MDFTLYWFMLPVAIAVASCAMLCGIGGAALFTPIFILVFPLLGPDYVLDSTVAAIGTALLTETFGFSSGFIGYLRKGTIDFVLARRFLWVSVPVGVLGAWSAHLFFEGWIIAGYALLVLVLGTVLMFFHHQGLADPQTIETLEAAGMREVTDSDGRQYAYARPVLGIGARSATGLGAFLTGVVSVGIGEVVVPLLTRRRVPVAIAAATSVAVVIATAAAASITLIAQIAAAGGAVAWHLVAWTIPGVLIGGQIGPRLQGRIEQRTMERFVGGVFLALAAAMFAVAIRKFAGA
jgi:uncharacterized membrane protein YfcA